MKKMFSGFYSSTDDEIKASWSSEKTLFVFDTNVLLNLYAYTEGTREDFFKILDKVSDKIWLPNHVALEYQRNRLGVVKNEKKIFREIEEYLKNIEKSINHTNIENLKLKQRLPSLFEESEKLHSSIDALLMTYRNSVKVWNDKQPDVRSSDKVRKKIDDLFNGKIGEPFEEQRILDAIYEEGKQRYDNSIPPGYKDKKEKENKKQFNYAGLSYIPMYGDLILWKQIIEKVKDKNIDSVILITDDLKEDWWYILDSSGKKEIGVRAELRDEIYRESNISSFELLTTSDFMRSGKEFLELEVEEESINEAKENTKINLKELQEKILESANLSGLAEAQRRMLESSNLSGLAEAQRKMLESNNLSGLVEAQRRMSESSNLSGLAEAQRKMLESNNLSGLVEAQRRMSESSNLSGLVEAQRRMSEVAKIKKN